ncbi:hypothetical protein LIER_16132 [Lithospermum erythrorhizon]|uniref:Uncharacterized protein n=1 Tax=Lithospermum erythrorhizon TaxID=34254 RepID=A0AAV3QAV1_LITER
MMSQNVMMKKYNLRRKLAMKDEMKALMYNLTWELANLPDRKMALQNKWVYWIKKEQDVKHYKTRFIVKGPWLLNTTSRAKWSNPLRKVQDLFPEITSPDDVNFRYWK